MKRKRFGSCSETNEKRPFIPPIITNFSSSSLEGTIPLSQGKDSSDSGYDSLFDGEEDTTSLTCERIVGTVDTHWNLRPAHRSAPPIPGLSFYPTVLIPHDVAGRLWKECMETYFQDGGVNQIMLFERARATTPYVSLAPGNSDPGRDNYIQNDQQSKLPTFLLDLLGILRHMLKDVVASDVHELLFPPDEESNQARQVILNHYRPGEGITPHVDLLNRYGDGIIGVNLHSGTVMDFTRVSNPEDESLRPNEPDNNLSAILPESHSIYLPERSVFVLTGEARYKWTHGISQRTEDLVQTPGGSLSNLLPRGDRLSITFRWLLPGADIVGD